MKRISSMVVAAAVLFALVPSLPAKEILEVPGTGEIQQVLTLLAGEFNIASKNVHVVIPESVESSGGIRQVLDGKATVARSARPLKAEERGKGLTEHLFAVAPVAFVAHPSVTGIRGVTREQVIGIFSGKLRNWKELGGPDAPIYAVDREPGDASRSVIEKQISGFAEVASIAKVFYSTREAATAIAEHPYTFGFLSMQAAREKGLTILALDGIQPTADQLKSGRYPLRAPFYLVTRGEPAGAARAFLDYLLSPQGQKKLIQLNVLPAR